MLETQCNAPHRALLPLADAAAWWRRHRGDSDAALTAFLLRHGDVELGNDPGRYALVATVRLELARRRREAVAA